MRKVENTRATVVGAARSGLAAAKLLERKGAVVFLTEQGEGSPEIASALLERGIAYEFGGHTDRALNADMLVLSPGVPSTTGFVQDAVAAGIPVYSEIEVASWFCIGPIVAVTGSNGKTTTTSLLEHLFRTANRDFVVAGNIGFPFSDKIEAITDDTAVVLEISSFQLDHIDTFRPHVSVLLNITPDHLNRYNDSFEQYAASKFRLFQNQQPSDWLVYNYDDTVVRDFVEPWCVERDILPWPISIEHELERGAFLRDDSIILALPNPLDSQSTMIFEEELMSSSDLALRGRHNLYNSLAAAISARAMEIRSDVVRQSLASFEGVPHRLEAVRTLNDVVFVNDSKATNVNAVWYALESFSEPIVLIAGGRDKGNDYGPLKRLVSENVKGIVGLGESGDKVLAELGPSTEQTARAHTMEEAVQYARLMAEPGDVVLLSPACASFDMYDNYEQRGEDFKTIVLNL
ncbi:MAG: UDP-N-acetylmuramoyl-L-alanine--D-glutamate ligase [Rubricoccaceae bacterium]|nr:UDP-N-acetylmuramoyl-L-alanine--D-glutamate ligase [Rubricoccaceae bacterium]